MSFFSRFFGDAAKPVEAPLSPANIMPVAPSRATEPTSRLPLEETPEQMTVVSPKKPFRVPPELRRAILDADAQPNPSFNSWRRNDRAIHELLGVAKGILADGVVLPEEVISLSQWVLANAEPDSGWPIDVVCHRLNTILADGQIDKEECEDLGHLLRDLVAAGVAVPDGYNAATKLPFTEPPPTPLEFLGSLFVLTGKFYYGPRTRCERAIEERGGTCGHSVTHQTNVLVIGSIGSRDWAHTSFGRKIEQAVDNQRNGIPTVIVGEEHWARHL